MSENFFDWIMRALNTPNQGEYWGIAADLNDKLDLNSLDQEDEAVIRAEQSAHEANLKASVGTEYEGDIPEYGMLRIQKDRKGILLFTFINNNGIFDRITPIKYLTSAELDQLTRNNATLWFDINGDPL